MIDFNEVETLMIGYYKGNKIAYEQYVRNIAKSIIANKIFLMHLMLDYRDKNYTEKFSQKFFWPFFAHVLIIRGESNINNVLSASYIWLQDLNWPGAIDYFDFLTRISEDGFKKSMCPNIEKAILTNDEEWLSNLLLLIRKKNIEIKFINKKLECFLIFLMH